jgi:hypothetical protein
MGQVNICPELFSYLYDFRDLLCTPHTIESRQEHINEVMRTQSIFLSKEYSDEPEKVNAILHKTYEDMIEVCFLLN